MTTTTKLNAGWKTETRLDYRGEFITFSNIAVGFGFVDAKGREIGCSATIEYWGGTVETNGVGGYVYILGTLRDGERFGASMGIRGARRAIRRATIEEAQRDAEAAIEKTRKAQAKKYGATIEAAPAPVVDAAPEAEAAPVVAESTPVEAEASAAPSRFACYYGANAVEVDAGSAVEARQLAVEALRVEARFARSIVVFEVHASGSMKPVEVPGPIGPVERPRCRNCGASYDPAVEGIDGVFVACGPCRHGQFEPGEIMDCACHRDPSLFGPVEPL